MRWLIGLLALTATLSAKEIYQISFKEVPGSTGGQKLLELTFFGKVPAPDEVDKLLRVSLEQAVLIDGSCDIGAFAFAGDDTLRAPQFSGPLFYKAVAKQILTKEALDQTKTIQYETPKYSVIVKDGKTLEGVKPARRWLTIQVVFSEEPSVPDAYEAAMTEIKKTANQGMDITAYVYVGDKDKVTARSQMKDPTGGGVFMRYDNANRKVMKKVDEYVTTLP